MRKHVVLSLFVFGCIVQYAFSQTVLTYTSNGSFTVPAGVTTLTVEGWGGGGGGGGATTALGSAGGGGGGGAYALEILSVTPGSTIPYVIGIGGAGGLGSGGAGAAGSGGDTYFNNVSTLLAKGGAGGFTSATAGTGGLGGSSIASVGLIKYSGGNGASGSVNTYSGGGGSSAGSASNGNSATAQTGGLAPTGGANGGSGRTTAGNGTVGSIYGGGGGGGLNPTSIARNGGSGANGKIVVSYFFAPTISSLIPSSGAIGSLITITGTNLSNATGIFIGGTSGIILSNSGTQIVGFVMPGATTGPVTVSTPGGFSTSTTNFTITPSSLPCSQQGSKLVGTGNIGAARQGNSVALSADGNTAIVGGHQDNTNQGAAWIWTRSGSSWTQQGSNLIGTGNVGQAYQGYSVAISADGNTAIVGGYTDNTNQGAAWIWTRSGSSWTQQGSKLVGTGNVGASRQGFSVSISADGNTAIVGGYANNSNQGAAWIYTRSGGIWTQQTLLVGTGNLGAAQQGFAVAMSADGKTAAVGGWADNAGVGAVWIWTRSGSIWTQQGSKLIGTGNIGASNQGYALAISADGNTVIVGGATDNSNQGAAWIWTRSGSTWTQQGSKLVGLGNVGPAYQGYSVSISADGNTAILGGYADNASNGAAWVFTRSGGIWTQSGNKLIGMGNVGLTQFGFSTSISADGNTALSGGYTDNISQGAAWVFTPGPGPTLSGFSPPSGSLGSVITLSGNNFSGVSAVSFGGITASSFVVVNSTTITAVVVAGASGVVSVIGNCGTATLGGFTYIPPTITSITPTSGPIGSLVTITGIGISSATGISIGGAAPIILSNSSTQIVGFVMPGATTGPVTVSTPGGFATSTASFSVTPSQVPCTQQGSKLVGTGNVGAANQGWSVSLSANGNTAIIGGYQDNAGQGAAWIYTRSNGIWTQQGSKLVGTGNVGAANQGSSVALSADGNTAIVGGRADNSGVGAAWIFTRSGGTWTQQGAKLVGTGVVGLAAIGQSVAISADGNTAIAGGDTDNSQIGAVWVWTRSGSTWTQQGSKLVGTGNVGSSRQGRSVAISADGNTAIVGAYADNSNQGAVWIWVRSGSTWTQQGSKLVGTGNVGAGLQGWSVGISADGNTAVVGAEWDNANQGAAWIWVRSGGIWTQQGSKLVGVGAVGTPYFGYSVAISADGDNVIVGGQNDNSSKGATWVFTRSGSTWTQKGGKLVGAGDVGGAIQGSSVSLSSDGNTAMVGGNSDNSSQGAVWVFTSGPSPILAGLSPSNGSFGSVVTLSGSNFTGVSAVSFGGITASSFVVVNSTTITAVVGAGASGVVSVVGACGTATIGGFTFYNSPIVITSLSALSANTGSVVTIVGYGFHASNNAVFVGTRKAPILSQSSSTIVIQVPCGSQNDFVTVVNLGNGLAGKSTQKFSTTFTASPLSAASFRPPVDLTSGGAINHNRLADLNNDGFLDLIVSNGTGTLHIYKNSGAATVSTSTYPVDYPLIGGTQFKFTEVADLDGDGKLDIIAADQGGTSSKIYLNTSPSTAVISFGTAITIPTTNCTAVASADLDKDGKLDLVVAQYNSSNPIKFFKNTSNIGTISFGSGVNIVATSGAHDVDLADWDGDGYEDVIASEEGSGQVSIYQNVGAGSSFPLAKTFPLSSAYNSDLGDFNNDGKIDLIVTSWSAAPKVYVNTSAIGSFSGNNSYTGSSASFGIDMNDLDGDNKLDLSFFNGTSIAAARNLGGSVGTSFNISAYTGTTFNMTSGDLNCDTYPEVVAASTSATYTRIIPNLPPISLTSFTPTTGTTASVITISGSNFANISFVSFGGITASSFVVVNSTTITAVLGTGASGVVAVSSTTLGTATLGGFTFTAQGAALDFDGSNDYVDISPVVPYTNDFTIEAWINTSQTSGVLFAWGDPIVNNYTTFEVYSNRLRLSSGMNGSLHYSDGSTIVTTGVWTHVAVTRSGNQISLYVNGTLDGTFSTTNRSNPSTSSIGAGLLNATVQGFYKGTIDNLRIWNRPLCQAEINNNRNAENPGNTAGLVAHYKFNQGIANSDNGTVTTALDNMGIYNGTLSGFTLNGTQSNWINPGGVAQNSNSAFFPNNTSAFISGFSPTTAFSGQLINISGGNFTGSDNVSAVYFGTTPASAFIVPSSNQIIATVGGGNTGVLKLNVGCGIATASGFIYLEPLSISGFTPQLVLPGGALTILGKGFDSDPLANQVSFDGLNAVVLAATENILVVRVPLEASVNHIYITTGAQSIKSSFPYIVGNRNCSNSSFTPPVLYSLPFGDGPIQISSIDINKDTSLDLVIGNYTSSEIKVQRGDGGGTFSLFNTIPTAASPTVMDFGDVNLDGNIDIVCGNTIGYEVFINDGFANLTQLVFNNGGDNVLGIKLTDLNNDGILDLVYSTPLNPSLYVALGNGLGSFINETAQPLGGMNPSKIVSHDFDKDGNMDIVFVDYSTSNFGVLLGKGNGSFQTVVSYPFGGSAGVDRIVTADFDHDGNYDLAMTSYTDQIFAIFRGNGNGTFTPLASPTSTGGYPNDIQLIDYNGDANLDLIIPIYSTGEVKIYAGNGLGLFSTNPVVIAIGPTPNSVAVGDFNRDNQVDFAVTNFSTHQFNVVRNSCPSLSKISHNGLWFDGVNDNVTINRPVQNDFTISFWMKTNSTFVAGGTKWFDGAGIIDAENSTSNSFDFGISMSKGYLWYGSGDFSTDFTDEGVTAINDNKWHHILVTRSEATGDVQLYIDGVRDIATTQVIGPLSGTPKVMFGRVQTNPQNAFEGQLDDIRFYDKVLSAAEIADTSIWNREANTSDANLVAYYKLDRDPIVEDEFTAKDFKGGNDGKVDYLNSNGPLFTRSVTSTADDYSAGTLRWAIRDFTQGTDQLSGKNYIDFSLQEVDPNAILSIDLRDSMSIKSDVILDGYSAYGSSKNKQSVGNDAQLRIAINFLGINPSDVGIQLNGARNSIIRGLSFGNMPNYFPDAYTLGSIGSSGNNSISGCWFGIYPDGTSSPNTNGIYINSDQGYNLIGGALPEHKNIISNNEYNGIVLRSSHNELSNNYIGTNSNGSSTMSNNASGVIIAAGTGTLIKENLISGNTNGILGIGYSTQATIVGNLIGTDATGANSLSNTDGIVLGDGNAGGIQYYTIGDTTKNSGNTIAYNTSNAISLNGLNSTVDNIRISGNSIFENGYGIALANSANADKVAPTITSAKTFLISGTCEADDWVEIYYDLPAFGLTNQGRRFLGVANTNGTTWTFPTKLAIGDRVTALAIKNPNQGGGKNAALGSNAPSGYNTSEFSAAATVSDSTPISQPIGNRGVYLEGNITSGSNLTTSFVPTNATDNVTLEAWVKLDSFPTNYLRFIAYNGNSSLNGYGIYVDPSGLVSCFVGGAGRGGVNFIGSTISLKSWNHVALVRESGFWYLYLNGVSQTYNPLSFPQNLAPDTPTDNLVIGNGFGETNPWAGQIDEVKIFNSARTASEILLDMASTNPDGAVGYWDFEEVNGNIAIDQSGSGNNATFVHNPLRSIRVTDTTDNGIAGLGSLRQAVTDANTDADLDYIDFSIQQTDPAKVSHINLDSPLTDINNPIVIDGYSAYGSSFNTLTGLTNGTNAALRVELKGTATYNALIGQQYAIRFQNGSDNSIVKGLAMNNFKLTSSANDDGALEFLNTNNAQVLGCFIGTDATGTAFIPNTLGIVLGSSSVKIGTSNAEDRNLIVGGLTSIQINGSDNTTVQNNLFGVSSSLAPLTDSNTSIQIWNTSKNNTIGGINTNEGNIIANNGKGVLVTFGATRNRISQNSIYNNGIGIDLGGGTGNGNKAAPIIISAYPTQISGSCQAGDIIEVFYDSPQFGTTNQGRVYLGQATTSGTAWSFLATLTVGSRITATATDGVNGTSPFSAASTVINFVPPTVPVGNRGIYFDGVDDFVDVPKTPSISFIGSNDFTIELWVKPSTIAGMTVFDNVANNDGPSVGMLNIWCQLEPNGTITYGVGTEGVGWDFISSNANYEVNKWLHLTLIKNGTTSFLYVNGALDNSKILVNTLGAFVNNVPFNFGRLRRTSDMYFKGQLDEIKVFNTARSASEIPLDMGSTSTGVAGLVGYWDFEDDAITGNQNSANDVSGNGNAGALTNGPLWAIRVTDDTDNSSTGLGSLRQAINDANTDTDKDYIDFSLPSGTQTIQPTTSYTLNNPVLIDGFSQLNTIPGENSKANTNAFGQPINAKLNVIINGTNAGSSDAFILAGESSEIKGLVVNGYSSSTAFNFSTVPFNVNYNKISGCFIGTDRDGNVAVPNDLGFRATGPSNIRTGNTIGGINQEDRNLISGNSIGIADFNTWYNGLIQNNYIGTNAAGNSAIPNTPGGGLEQLINSQNVIIANNVISGNAGTGVFIASATTGNHVIKGNRIGTTADGLSSLPNGANGITIFANSNNTIGGLGIGDANIIANNGQNGVSIIFSGINNIVLNNSIYNNVASGIDLTSNVNNGNNNKPAPTINSAFPTLVSGSCQTGDLVEVFYDSPQFGTTNQGRVYLGQATTSGTAWSFLATLTVGSRITATATDGVNGTSPFSAAATVVNFIPGAALDFDGVDDYVISNDLTLADFGTNDFTVEAWFNTTVTGGQVIFSNRYEGSNGHFFNLQMGNGNLAAEIDDGLGNYAGTVVTTSTYNDGNWHHVALARRGTSANLYVDGTNILTLTTTGIPNVSRGVGFLVGFRYVDSSVPTGFFKGQMDGIRLWTRALCQSEIQNYKNVEKPGNLTGLKARYDFNQGFSRVTNTGIVTLFDSSGNGKHATLNNFDLNGPSSNWIAPGAVLTGSTTASVNCIPGAALDFNGFNTYVSTNLWSDTLKNFTMEASVYWRGGSSGDQAILYNGLSSSNGYGIVIRQNIGDQLTLLLGGSAWILTGTQLPVNSWSKIVAVNDNKNWSLYLNGTALALSSYTDTAITINGITNSYIGNTQSFDSGFNGTIDNVRFWNRPLCQAEINAHQNCEKPANSAGLIARYDFNSGIAGDNNTGVITAVDSSGNGNHGTLFNFALTSTISNWVAPGSVLSGSTCAGVSIPAGGTWTWVGGNSDDWFSPCNWDKLSVPTAAANVLIPGSTPNQPAIRNSPAYCNKIDIITTNGGVLNLDSSSGGKLIITQ